MRIRTPSWRAVAQLGAAYWLAPRVMGEVVRHIGDRDLEKRLGTHLVQRAIFAAMTRGYDARAGDGFRGRIVFELTRPLTGESSFWWTVSVDDDGAHARSGQAREPEVRVRVPLADFLRIAGGVADPIEPVLAGRGTVSGDLGVAARLAEMFGSPQVR